MATVGTLCGLLAIAGACDTNARFNVNQITYKETRILGAWPAADQNGALVPQCGAGGIDGFIFNFAMTSTQRTEGDPDNSIRPGDVVATVTVDGDRSTDIKLSGTNNIGLEIDCLDPLPDTTGGSSCEGVAANPAATNVQYRDLATRGQAKNILFVVDVSGSTSGFVDASDSREYPNDGTGTLAVGKLQEVASDWNGFRWAQLKTFIDQLQDNDRMGIIAFREKVDGGSGIATPCFKPNAQGIDTLAGDPWDTKLRACFGGATESWLTGIDNLDNQKNWGRSNLWEAVEAAHDFMTEIPNEAANHIIVLTDGPDSCGYTQGSTDCAFDCGGTSSVDTVLQKIAAAQGGNPRRDIHVHFVQFDSIGYRGPDAAQLEVACASRGHHQFINRTALPTDQPGAFQAALANAMENVRFALMGNWQLDVRASALASGQTPFGTMFSLKGAITVQPSSKLVTQPDVEVFSGGENGVLDKRPKIRKACGAPADCGATPDNECIDYCTADTKLCLGGATGVPKKNNTPCAGGVSCCTNSAGATSCLAQGESCDTCSN